MESDAEDRLALVADARARASDGLATPWWYHLTLAALTSALVLAIGLGLGTWWYAVVVVLVLVGEGVVVRAYRRTVGVWATTWDTFPRWALWLAFGVGLAPVVAAGVVRLWVGWAWPVWVLAALMFGYMVVLGRWSDGVWRARMRAAA